MIVGLLGFIGSGKGTAGDILKDMGFTPVSFAKGVKDVTAEMFGWPRHLLEGDTQVSREWREQPDKFWSEEFGKPFNVHYQYRRWRWQWSWDHTFHVWFHDSNDALIAALKFRGIYGELT